MVVKLTQEQADYLETFGEKMLIALINGYEVDVPKYKFYNFSNITNIKKLYYAGKDIELTEDYNFAKAVKKNSNEYLALECLGFDKEEV